jgi:hypothetical protein
VSPPFIHQHRLLELLGKPLTRLGVNRHNHVRIDLLDGPGDILAASVPQSMITLLESRISVLVQQKAAGSNAEALQPVP